MGSRTFPLSLSWTSYFSRSVTTKENKITDAGHQISETEIQMISLPMWIYLTQCMYKKITYGFRVYIIIFLCSILLCLNVCQCNRMWKIVLFINSRQNPNIKTTPSYKAHKWLRLMDNLKFLMIVLLNEGVIYLC